MASQDVEIAIVGAGIGGLTLALALRRHGIAAAVHERADALTEIGAAVALAANGTRILRELGLGEALEAHATVPTALIHRRWDIGRPVSTHPVGSEYADRFGSPFWGIHRADLQRVLAESWGPADLHLGRELCELDEDGGGMRLRFSSGEAVRAAIVVGADGIGSRVRRHITATAPVYSGTSGFRGLVPRSAVPDLPDPDAVQFWMGPGAHLLHYAVGDVVNFLAVEDGPRTWPSSDSRIEAAPGELADRFAGWHPAARRLITAVPQSPRWALSALPSLHRWSRGRTVLLGDAAHAMLPHHGQGANQTIEDATVLADLLAAHGTSHHRVAFAAYERVRRARTRQVALSSAATSTVLHLPDHETIPRDTALPRLTERFGWIHSYDHRHPRRG